MTRGTRKAAPAREGDLMPAIRIGRLDSVHGWRKELGRLYRAMRRGELSTDIGTKLAYVANVAAKLVQIEEELRSQQRLADALKSPGSIPMLSVLPHGQLIEEGDSQHADADQVQP